MSTSIGPNDICVVIRSKWPENIGRIVRVLRFVRDGARIPLPDGTYVKCRGDGLLVESLGAPFRTSFLSSGAPTTTPLQKYRASSLRKLDNPKGKDETLAWKKVPRVVAKPLTPATVK